MSHHDGQSRFAAVRHLARHGPEEGEAERIDVRAAVNVFGVPGLLGRHVGRSSHRGVRLGNGRILLGALRQPEVRQLHVALVCQQDIGRLDVAVNDLPTIPGVVEGPRDLVGDADGLLDGKLEAPPQPILEGLPIDILHGEVVVSLVLARFVDHDDVGMVEAAGRLRLTPEPLDLCRLLHHFLRQHLERDAPVEPVLQGFVHAAHAALANLPDNRVLAQAIGLRLALVSDAFSFGDADFAPTGRALVLRPCHLVRTGDLLSAFWVLAVELDGHRKKSVGRNLTVVSGYAARL